VDWWNNAAGEAVKENPIFMTVQYVVNPGYAMGIAILRVSVFSATKRFVKIVNPNAVIVHVYVSNANLCQPNNVFVTGFPRKSK
jgi:hypothetical protein